MTSHKGHAKNRAGPGRKFIDGGSRASWHWWHRHPPGVQKQTCRQVEVGPRHGRPHLIHVPTLIDGDVPPVTLPVLAASTRGPCHVVVAFPESRRLAHRARGGISLWAWQRRMVWANGWCVHTLRSMGALPTINVRL
jgi:hypothetical protein